MWYKEELSGSSGFFREVAKSEAGKKTRGIVIRHLRIPGLSALHP
jgi:hypothetical protein